MKRFTRTTCNVKGVPAVGRREEWPAHYSGMRNVEYYKFGKKQLGPLRRHR